MKVFNLTDVPTEALVTHQLRSQTLVVGKAIVSPGQMAEVEDGPHFRRKLEHLVQVGALALDKLPAVYVAQKAKLGADADALVSHGQVRAAPELAPKVAESAPAADEASPAESTRARSRTKGE